MSKMFVGLTFMNVFVATQSQTFHNFASYSTWCTVDQSTYHASITKTDKLQMG